MNGIIHRFSPVVGVALGIGSVLLSNWLAAPDGTELPFTLIVVLAVALAGLGLGLWAAFATYLAGAVTLVVVILGEPAGSRLQYSDVVRLIAFAVGSAAIVYLTWRADVARETASRALATSREAEALAEGQHRAVEQTREELDQALEQAERERARLQEVAEAIPEPLIVYDPSLRGTFGNRAALQLFGRSFVERPIDEWGRMTDPRDEHGVPLERGDWPQVVAQTHAVQRRLVLRIPMSGKDVIVDVEGTPIPGGGAVLLLRDVGKEEDERRRLSRFASFVAHELRNPLAVAKARIELALRDADHLHSQRDARALAPSSRSTPRSAFSSGSSSTRARTAGSVEAVREPFELSARRSARRSSGCVRPGRSARSQVSLPPGMRVIGDRQLTELAITNLLTNANRYSEAEAPIHVEVERGRPRDPARARRRPGRRRRCGAAAVPSTAWPPAVGSAWVVPRARVDGGDGRIGQPRAAAPAGGLRAALAIGDREPLG